MKSIESATLFLQSCFDEKGLPEGYTEKNLLDLYSLSADPSFAANLFKIATTIRDLNLGSSPWWSAGISAITPCEIEPSCTYCTFFTRSAAEIEDIVAAAQAIASLGIRHLHLSGGSRLATEGAAFSGYDSQMIDLVSAIKDAVDMEIEVNVGPSLTRKGVRALQKLGVVAVTSSLEVFNSNLFERYKPGDSLSGRIRLMEICEEEGMPIRSMILVGLGESDEDRIAHLIFLRRFSMLRHLRFSRFIPFPNATAGGVRCSPWPVARLIAVARLLLPTIDLGLAAGNSPDDLPLWWLAGGGNQVLGASVSMRVPQGKGTGEGHVITVNERVAVHNKMQQITRYLDELGLTPIFLK
ncbi:MAG: radical SAM protein [Desulfocapsaceae bacterium]|nr:radical SAM protein [Desulfocapsaceae bacterium]